MLILKALYNYFPLRERDKMLLRPFFCVGEFGTDSFLARPRRKMFPAVFVEGFGCVQFADFLKIFTTVHLFPPEGKR